MLKLEIKTCKRCEKDWCYHGTGRPRRCGKCKSPYWDKERIAGRECVGEDRRKSALAVVIPQSAEAPRSLPRANREFDSPSDPTKISGVTSGFPANEQDKERVNGSRYDAGRKHVAKGILAVPSDDHYVAGGARAGDRASRSSVRGSEEFRSGPRPERKESLRNADGAGQEVCGDAGRSPIAGAEVGGPSTVKTCGFESFNGDDGESYRCGLPVHGPKIKHGAWVKQ